MKKMLLLAWMVLAMTVLAVHSQMEPLGGPEGGLESMDKCLFNIVNDQCKPGEIEYCVCDRMGEKSKHEGPFESCDQFWKCRPSECKCSGQDGQVVVIMEIIQRILMTWSPELHLINGEDPFQKGR